MTNYNKIVTTVNSVTQDYTAVPDPSCIVIDTSNNRIGINNIDPDYEIDVTGTIKSDIINSKNIFPIGSSNTIGSIDKLWDKVYANSYHFSNENFFIEGRNDKITINATELEVLGTLTIRGNFESTQSNNINGVIVTTCVIKDCLSIYGTPIGYYSISGSTDNDIISGDICSNVMSDARFKKLYVLYDASFNQNVEISGQLTVDGDAIFNQNVEISGQLTVDGDAIFNQNVEISGQLTVDGDAIFNQAVTISGDFDITNGSSTFSNQQFTVQGDASFNQNVEISDQLIVHGYTNFNNNVTIDSAHIYNPGPYYRSVGLRTYNYAPTYGRLNVNNDEWWDTDFNSSSGHTISFETFTSVAGIITQGGLDGWWTPNFTIKYKNSNGQLEDVKNIYDNLSFTGNTNANSLVYNYFYEPVLTTEIIITPTAGSLGNPYALRAALIINNFTVNGRSAFHNHVTISGGLNVENGDTSFKKNVEISNQLIVNGDVNFNNNVTIDISDIYNPSNDYRTVLNGRYGKLYDSGDYWYDNDNSKFLGISFETATKVIGVVTQGRSDGDEWTTQFKVKYRDLNGSMIDVRNINNDLNFIGNTDRNSLVYNYFYESVLTDEIQLNPTTWNGSNFGLRAGLLINNFSVNSRSTFNNFVTVSGGLNVENGAITCGIITTANNINTTSITSSSSNISLNNKNLTNVGTIGSGAITASSLTSNGTITANSLTSSGNDITLNNKNLTNVGTIGSGAITASSLTSTGTITANSINTSSGTDITLNNKNLTNVGTIDSGTITASSLTSTGAITAGSLTSNGTITANSLTSSGNDITLNNKNLTNVGTIGSGAITASSLTSTGTITANSINTSSGTDITLNNKNLTNVGTIGSGTITASSLTSTGAITAGSLTSTGTITANSLTSSGNDITLNNKNLTNVGTIGSGAITASSLTSNGTITANSLTSSGNDITLNNKNLTNVGTIGSGAITASSLTSTGTITANSINTSSGTDITLNNKNLTNVGTIDSGTITASSLTSTGAITASSLTSNGTITANSLTSSGNDITLNNKNLINVGTIGSGAITASSLTSSGTITTGQIELNDNKGLEINQKNTFGIYRYFSSPLRLIETYRFLKLKSDDGDNTFWEFIMLANNTTTGDGWADSTNEGSNDLLIAYGNSRNNYNEYNKGAWIQSDGNAQKVDFTGQHRCLMSNNLLSSTVGLIVSTTNKYINIDNSIRPRINESLPYCELTKTENDKKVFGVISDKEDNSNSHKYSEGFIGSLIPKASKNERRMHINSVGEGSIWVCNINGGLENGDYISSSNVLGYGQKQILHEDFLTKFTVAKITCDCDFNLTKIPRQKLKTQTISNESYIVYDSNGDIEFVDDLDNSENQIFEYKYDTRFLDASANILNGEHEYNNKKLNGENVYIACFVGCTYHCG